MRTPAAEPGDGPRPVGHNTDFSLVLGGPLFQLLRRAHLSDDALMMARQRVIVIALLAWLPLLVLSALEGRALGGGVAVPFLFDVEVQIRYLVALPLLIGAELIVHRRMRSILEIFQERRLIPEPAMPRFDAAIASAMRLAQLGARRDPADRPRVWRRHPGRLAPVPGARRGHLVRDAFSGRLDAVVRRHLVWLRQPAAVPVPAPALVLPRCSSGRAFSGRCRASS